MSDSHADTGLCVSSSMSRIPLQIPNSLDSLRWKTGHGLNSHLNQQISGTSAQGEQKVNLFCKNNDLNPLYCLVCHGFDPKGSSLLFLLRSTQWEWTGPTKSSTGKILLLGGLHPDGEISCSHKGLFHMISSSVSADLLLPMLCTPREALDSPAWKWGKHEEKLSPFPFLFRVSSYYLLVFIYFSPFTIHNFSPFISLHSFHSTKTPEGRSATDTG